MGLSRPAGRREIVAVETALLLNKERQTTISKSWILGDETIEFGRSLSSFL